ncbi:MULTISPECIES: hypothetical protein [Mycobacteriaceae]|uniref:Helix-turn-helix domain-containing protein n=1 Tax=Mycolicibacterium elephantis TaxID=81858 RepID=A0A1X0DA24_9MYCO|nr:MULTISPECIES: hypothetical protein [Mycobacteriaceae]MCV7259200.1 hypothetical protein [Mycobacterium shimoidei]ODR05822.1 hypothetical protein BHQ16_21975 [Mycobacterium shimoidei]ORA69188.1 hypothetical protein BST23_00555 [Mycolicibacterium elephantis]ORW79598.1 hypothetical protein AWC26_14355 [Mycobacterium shimoidei]
MDIDPIDVPNLDEDGSFEYVAYELDVPVTRRAIKYAVMRREVLPTRIGRKNLFSRRDWLDWIASRKQPGHYRAPESVVGQKN